MAASADSDLPAGLRYMVEHGHAADGSHALNTEPTQHLVNPRAENPTRHPAVADWVRGRVQADEQMRSAKEAS
ncbi:MAG TPA: hypothetical protein VFT67_09175 [Jatrophihabitantaceae bacterium]|nr:hypothetical protein [Jatrophihabitantaceae bacterium]